FILHCVAIRQDCFRRCEGVCECLLAFVQIFVQIERLRHIDDLLEICLVSLLEGQILHCLDQVLPALIHHLLGDGCIACLHSCKDILCRCLGVVEDLDYRVYHAFGVGGLCKA